MNRVLKHVVMIIYTRGIVVELVSLMVSLAGSTIRRPCSVANSTQNEVFSCRSFVLKKKSLESGHPLPVLTIFLLHVSIKEYVLAGGTDRNSKRNGTPGNKTQKACSDTGGIHYPVINIMEGRGLYC